MTEEASKVRTAKKLPVMEIFGPTIQGEGAMIGVQTHFIRFGLCDYKCTMCDSMHAVDPLKVKANARWQTPAEIMERIVSMSGFPTWMTLSGGNPCIHDLGELVVALQDAGVKVAVETQGTMLPDWVSMCDVITVSPKSPGMGETFEYDKFLNYVQQFQHHKGFNVKVVVFSEQDLVFAQSINMTMCDYALDDKMYLSLGNPYPPGLEAGLSDDELKLALMKQYSILTEDLLKLPNMTNVKFLPQLHVLAWANKQEV